MVPPNRANERWSLVFVSDAFTDGRWFRILAIVDDHGHECSTLLADRALFGIIITCERNYLIAQRGKSSTINSDN